MLSGMESDVNVHWPDKFPVGGAGAAGDNVIYSSRVGDVPGQDPGPVLGTRRIMGWYKANAASTYKVQIWSRQAAAWVTINNSGSGVAVASGDVLMFSEHRPSGDHRIVANFAVAPTTFEHAPHVRLAMDAATQPAGG